MQQTVTTVEKPDLKLVKNIHQKLVEIQAELVAPKNLTNNFGGYNYRSCESILEAVKPLLKVRGLYLTINDEMINIGERYYIKATATLTDGEQTIQTSALAREAENKKGMDDSQITGATSSYARKYALNGLFCIDDTKDADATNTHGKEETKKAESKSEGFASKEQIKELRGKVSGKIFADTMNTCGGNLPLSQFSKLMKG